jgi:hypothetical protein
MLGSYDRIMPTLVYLSSLTWASQINNHNNQLYPGSFEINHDPIDRIHQNPRVLDHVSELIVGRPLNHTIQLLLTR